jgi:hypothetical protein
MSVDDRQTDSGGEGADRHPLRAEAEAEAEWQAAEPQSLLCARVSDSACVPFPSPLLLLRALAPSSPCCLLSSAARGPVGPVGLGQAQRSAAQRGQSKRGF